jgi:hypothetical protein
VRGADCSESYFLEILVSMVSMVQISIWTVVLLRAWHAAVAGSARV